MRNKKVLFMVQFALLLAIEAIVCFTPLGSLPAFGPIVATLMMIPVILTSILLGTGAGSAMGFFAGLFSFIIWTFMPPAQSVMLAFVFTPFYTLGQFTGNALSLVICFVPRILAGTVTGLLHTYFKKTFKDKPKDVVTYGLSGFIGSLVNTFGVLGGIYLFFGKTYASVLGLAFEALIGIIGLTILTSGIPEAIIGGIVGYGVGKPLKKYILKKD